MYQNAIKYNVRKLSKDFLDFILQDAKSQEILKNPTHFSLIQYSNIEAIITNINTSIDVYNSIARLPRSSSFLNIGTGPGILERIVDLHQKVNLESVEWEEQAYIFNIINTYLNVKPNYYCNDITKDNFEIFECDKKYDYILLIRFFPLNRSMADLEKVKNILAKLKRYSDKAVLIDFYGNYNKNICKYFNSIQTDRLPCKKELDHWVLDLTKV